MNHICEDFGSTRCRIFQLFLLQPVSVKSTPEMAPVSYTEICKQLEGCYNLERITIEQTIDPEEAATHVRYYIPLTSQ